MTRTLWHYTCTHSRSRIGVVGLLVPARQLVDGTLDDYWPSAFVWLTDLSVPSRDVLGLTSNYQRCDRTAYRYRVTDTQHVHPWVTVRRTVPDAELLEAITGCRPRHWFVSTEPVPVELDGPTE